MLADIRFLMYKTLYSVLIKIIKTLYRVLGDRIFTKMFGIYALYLIGKIDSIKNYIKYKKNSLCNFNESFIAIKFHMLSMEYMEALDYFYNILKKIK